MNIGIAYYPEYTNKERWYEDFKDIAELGIKRVRMSEFAWSLMEPEKGFYNWEWLDSSIELAGKLGIEIILSTPTACPPVWLVEKFPEILPVNKEGRRSGFGARQHRCYNSPRYVKYSYKIVEMMAARYGKHSNVVAWQIDNELGGEQKYCYCDNCRREFQNFLEKKYITIENLNERWMNHFWSQDYQNFSQIPVPMSFASDLKMRHHPSLELEFCRFSSDSIVRFSNRQAEILKKYTDKVITTNTDTFYWGDNVNINELFKKLDIGGMDVYSEKMHEIGFYSDITRSLKKDYFWMMEFGPGSRELSSQMELMKKSGCEWFSIFTYRTFSAGQEYYVKGLRSATNEKEESYHIIKNWCKKEISSDKYAPQNPEVGIYYNFDSSWAYTIDSPSIIIEDRLIYPKYLMDVVYKSFFESDVPIQFVFEIINIQSYKYFVLAWQLLYDERLEETLINYVENGGILIVTNDLFKRNMDNANMANVPDIYKKLLNWNRNTYVDDINYINQNYGNGKVFMINKDSTIEDWKNLIADIVK